jgi:membrane associated rhomboid family serine protease
MIIGIIALFVVQLVEQQWFGKFYFERLLALQPAAVLQRFQAWRLLTWPIVQVVDASVVSDVLWACAGLYFFGTDLEETYGTRRFVLFVVFATVLTGIVATITGRFHPVWFVQPVKGVAPLGFALTVAWGTTFPHKRMLFPPVSARVLVWILVGIALLTILARAGRESPAPSIGAIAVGWLLGRYWNRVEDFLDRRQLKALKAKRDGGLRVIPGGKSGEKGKPVDKRYLN